MLDQTFSKILIPLSDKINYNEGKLKGAVDYYFNRKNEFENVLEEEKKFLDNFKKSYNNDIEVKKTAFDSNNDSLVKNPFNNQLGNNNYDSYSDGLIYTGNNSKGDFNKSNKFNDSNKYNDSNKFDDTNKFNNQIGDNQFNNSNQFNNPNQYNDTNKFNDSNKFNDKNYPMNNPNQYYNNYNQIQNQLPNNIRK